MFIYFEYSYFKYITPAKELKDLSDRGVGVLPTRTSFAQHTTLACLFLEDEPRGGKELQRIILSLNTIRSKENGISVSL